MTAAAIDLRCELRVGRWQDALADVGEVDALISDPPYSERTHSAYREMKQMRRRVINYGAFGANEVNAFVDAWAPRTRGWMVVLTDHVLMLDWASAMERNGRYTFAPVACVEPGSRVRLTGDGPTSWTVYAIVSRPRTTDFSRWGALRGAYVVPSKLTRLASRESESRGAMGSKPLWLMRELIGDYTRRGDLIVDPCAGGATTLIAARSEGRHSVGAELDPATYELARKRIVRPYPLGLFDALGGVDHPSDVHGLGDSQTDDAER
jgi:site-specific DNA-methyltransferase (adenine-specific)